MQGNQRHPDPQQTAKDVATSLARPLFSPTRRPREAAKSVGATDPELSDVRLAGIVIQPDRRLAIFAVAGAKPRTLLLGEALNGWKIDSISPEEVALSGPGGTRTLQPKIDTKLVRQRGFLLRPHSPNPLLRLARHRDGRRLVLRLPGHRYRPRWPSRLLQHARGHRDSQSWADPRCR